MDLYDPKYLHCAWDESLKGKKVFYGDCISTVIADVESGSGRDTCRGYSGDTDLPFRMCSADFAFVYCDKNYDVKVAYAQGKQVQYRCPGVDDWEDCPGVPFWSDTHEYRVKPEPEPVPLRPYDSAAELMDAYRKKYSVPETTMPFMWLCRRCCAQKSLVLSVDFDADRVTLVYSGSPTLCSYGMDEVMTLFTFPDGSPCGRQAEE